MTVTNLADHSLLLALPAFAPAAVERLADMARHAVEHDHGQRLLVVGHSRGGMLARAGADVVIVGEAVIRATDPQQFVAELVAAGSHPALLTATHREGL